MKPSVHQAVQWLNIFAKMRDGVDNRWHGHSTPTGTVIHDRTNQFQVVTDPDWLITYAMFENFRLAFRRDDDFVAKFGDAKSNQPFEYSSPWVAIENLDDSDSIKCNWIGFMRCSGPVFTSIDLWRIISAFSNKALMTNSIRDFTEFIHQQNRDAGWHDEPREFGTQLMLVVSEIAEAMEGHRKGLMDTHLVHRSSTEVELADAVIRIMDICGAFGFDLEGAIKEKLVYNRFRVDHTREHRASDGGKKY